MRQCYDYFLSYDVMKHHTVPYTRVNKRMRLFAKLQENMRLIPNMRLIAKGNFDHTSKTAMPSLVARANAVGR